jgi:hypothetical protein
MFSGGEGTVSSPYLIANGQDLDAIRGLLPAANLHFKLIEDIDLYQFSNWTPIGTTDQPFSGYFDGNMRTIHSIYIDVSEGLDAGLFGALSGATIIDLLLDHVHITGTGRAGALAAFVTNETLIKQVSARQGAISGGNEVGGLIGFMNQSSSILDSSAHIQVTGDTAVGGLIGYSDRANQNRIFATGEVKGEQEVGGLIGRLAVVNKFNNLTDSYSTSKLIGKSSSSKDIGGLIGSLEKKQSHKHIYRTYAATEFLGTNNVHGLVAKTNRKAELPDSYWDQELADFTGGIGSPQTTSEMKRLGTYMGWNFSSDGPWGIMENFSYPYLKNEARLELMANLINDTYQHIDVTIRILDFMDQRQNLDMYMALVGEDHHILIEPTRVMDSIDVNKDISFAADLGEWMADFLSDNSQLRLWVWVEDAWGRKSEGLSILQALEFIPYTISHIDLKAGDIPISLPPDFLEQTKDASFIVDAKQNKATVSANVYGDTGLISVQLNGITVIEQAPSLEAVDFRLRMGQNMIQISIYDGSVLKYTYNIAINRHPGNLKYYVSYELIQATEITLNVGNLIQLQRNRDELPNWTDLMADNQNLSKVDMLYLVKFIDNAMLEEQSDEDEN